MPDPSILSAHSWQLEHVDARGEHYSCSCGETLVVAPDGQAPMRTRTGRVLTDADVEGFADEAERGYELPGTGELEPDDDD